jgi:predicted dehydrogenase
MQSRRSFLKKAATAVIAPMAVPASALGKDGTVAPSNRVTLGVIGSGGKATSGMQSLKSHPAKQFLAVCDVLNGARERARKIVAPDKVKLYEDFRDLIARDDIDAVLVATPDHWHVLASIHAARAGKHVYCEKPLGATVEEGQALARIIKEEGVVFQHGTQLRSTPGVLHACELVRNGYIGDLKSVTIGSPPGHETGAHPPEEVPKGFNWDLWQGPAVERPYTEWRVRPKDFTLPGWYFCKDYSPSGWIAGYAVHDTDIAHWGMDMERSGPVSVEGEGVFPNEGLWDTVLTYKMKFEYPNGVTLNLTTTDLNPHGVRFEGTEGWVFTRGRIEASDKTLLDVTIGDDQIKLHKSANHEHDFLNAIIAGHTDTLTPADVAHRSTTPCLIGGICLDLKRKLEWDPKAEQFVDDDEANKLLSRPMRKPWTLDV